MRNPAISILVGLIVAVSLSTVARADGALDLWAQGKYEEAIAAGLADKSADGLSAAARAAVSKMTLQTALCLPCIERAEDLSRQALAAEPKAAVSSFCLAGALAYHGRMIGTINVQSAAIGNQARKTLEEAIAAHPDDARLIAGMAIWNFEVVRAGGSMLARLVYGATMDRGLALYDEAFKLSPNDMLINYQYGLSLSAYDPDEYKSKIEAAWMRVATAHPQNAYDEEMKSRVAKLLALRKSGDRKIFDGTVKDYLGLPR
jgi:hypothetical protein